MRKIELCKNCPHVEKTSMTDKYLGYPHTVWLYCCELNWDKEPFYEEGEYTLLPIPKHCPLILEQQVLNQSIISKKHQEMNEKI